MPFSASIFYPNKSRQFDFTLSEKLTYYSLITIISYVLLLLLIETSFGYDISKYAYCLLIVPVIMYLIGGAIRLNEYENLNGSFIGTISFEDNFLIIDTEQYQYNKIENLILQANSYSGQSNENTRSGPMYSNGVQNSISFIYDHQKIFRNFKLDSERHIDELQSVLLDIITNEKIPYQRKYLNLINSEYRLFIEFELFVAKLIKEKRMECTEGLLFIGYNSDQEAKEMRAKYCC
ncbi:hypothetical protein KHA90_17175 [Flavobacterium psychroterrae]|uniref:SMODS-associated NUDIX domain-containing protein n=1 Tax=Flavobacterium psychroterrae TaxID=2133767 RepID=A0ABS5PEM5_9FLAO|nr:hypothetical protein [Flavobacterium psychroterrae]MBS7232752.1 hypothetical protein [Flavobacterium psychroterrae]